ncbi:hypothetical protein FHG87_024974 [Trinorchestia longiramus]|nr:hypothetical protein FHG87_024974 [Trinorchestia longiramus]
MPPPPDRGRAAVSGCASLLSRPSRAPLLPQSQPSSKSRTTSPATAISSQANPNVPNPKPLTTLLPLTLPSTPVILSRPHTRSTHGSIRQNKKFGDILSQSLKLNFNIDTTFPDRDSTAILNFYYDKTDSQQSQTTQTAPQEEHTMNQKIDTAMDETEAATYTEIRQKNG